MKRKINKTIYKKGFMATIAVVLLSTGIMALSLSVMSAVIFYSDAVNKQEMRIQAKLNAEACLDEATLMAIKDYFLKGEISISKFDCTADITNDFNGSISLIVSATLGGVTIQGKRSLIVGGNSVSIIYEEIY